MIRKRAKNLKKLKAILPYLITGIITLTIVFVGSIDKKNSNTNLSLGAFASEDHKISVDQLSEFYVVADLSDALGLASATDVASNYVSIASMYDSGQTSTDKIEKPVLPDISACRGVFEYKVPDGVTMQDIADKYGISTDEIRWSNGLKTTGIWAGQVLHLPCYSGIVYTVKSGDTIASIVEKYGSSEMEIVALNDLEVSGISEGMKILIRGGSLPETERPEYVAPRPVYRTTYTYTYLGNTSLRTGLVCNRGLGAGQCTTWGWLKRPDLAFIKANANRWDDIARANGVLVNHTPSAGAIFQTDSGWYGHVGYVESVNADGSINVSERNYAGCYGVLYSTIPASAVGRFNYIH